MPIKPFRPGALLSYEISRILKLVIMAGHLQELTSHDGVTYEDPVKGGGCIQVTLKVRSKAEVLEVLTYASKQIEPNDQSVGPALLCGGGLDGGSPDVPLHR